MATWTVFAEFDTDDGVWVVRASDMPGLHVDGTTIEELGRKAAEHVATLLEVNAEDFDQERLAGPHSVRIVAHHERAWPVAA